MKRHYFLLLWLCFCRIAAAQTGLGYRPGYHLLRFGDFVKDKNFYLLTVIEHSPDVKKILQKEYAFSKMDQQNSLDSFKWKTSDTALFSAMYQQHQKVFDVLINRQLRPSGYYQRYKDLSNEQLLTKAWANCMIGMNAIIDVYGLGKKMRYPDIDSASYPVGSEYYQDMLKTMLNNLNERRGKMTLFYQPSLEVALQLLRINERDEAARYEPLENKANRIAVQKAKLTNWKQYPYSSILAPGEGPELESIAISPAGKMRCEMAAERYRKHLAPFIIVSGGQVHPFHTPYCEAVEMKKYLIGSCHIPSSAIIIEPQARHTTTNFRNSERLMIRYGFPIEKPALCVTTKDQEDYIDNAAFDKRNLRELGYLPFRDKKRLGDHELSFYPVLESLQVDPIDPLDP